MFSNFNFSNTSLLSENTKQFSNDLKYKKYFESYLAPKIYNIHINNCFICCTFCKHLVKSSCHEFCFRCRKEVYKECGYLLPGTFSFVDSHFDSIDNYVPWIFRTPCTGFERINQRKYFKKFASFEKSITVENYEALEGLFLGISRDKKPCHICASVNIDIYNKCVKDKKNTQNEPCYKIIHQVASKYKALSGMVKCID